MVSQHHNSLTAMEPEPEGPQMQAFPQYAERRKQLGTAQFAYKWSEEHIKAMQLALSEFQRDERTVSRKRREKLSQLATQSLSYIAGVACSNAVISEIFPKEATICASSGPSSDRGCTDQSKVGIAWRIMFCECDTHQPVALPRVQAEMLRRAVCVLVGMTVFFFWLLFRLKKGLMRRVEGERRAEHQALTPRDEDGAEVDANAMNAAIAHQLKADFYGSSFEMWSGGWSYSIMISWSVLLRTLLPLDDFDPWVVTIYTHPSLRDSSSIHRLNYFNRVGCLYRVRGPTLCS